MPEQQIDVHSVRNQVLAKKISVGYIPSFEQVVDCLTKPLTHTRFWNLQDKLG